jgi:multiple sugar transport system substrate-binding protein
MGRHSNNIHVWNSLLERAGFTFADIPKDWDGFWAFWCGRVQPAVRAALGRDDVWGVGLPMSEAARI